VSVHGSDNAVGHLINIHVSIALNSPNHAEQPVNRITREKERDILFTFQLILNLSFLSYAIDLPRRTDLLTAAGDISRRLATTVIVAPSS
jgi:hypothetical protein